MQAHTPTFYILRPNGLSLSVKAKPGTTRARAPKIVDCGNDTFALEIAVAAQPEDGKANKAIIDFLSKMLEVKKADITLKVGASGRQKIIEIAGDPAALEMRLLTCIQTHKP